MSKTLRTEVSKYSLRQHEEGTWRGTRLKGELYHLGDTR